MSLVTRVSQKADEARNQMLSRMWAPIFQKALHGIPVTVGMAKPGETAYTQLVGIPGRQMFNIFISRELGSEMGQVGALFHEYGHIEKDSFSLKHPELEKLSAFTNNVIEDVCINVEKAEHYAGFREGLEQFMRPQVKTRLGCFLYNTTQGVAGNPREQAIFDMAQRINRLPGRKRDEERTPQFYEAYLEFARTVVRYIGDQKEPPKGGAGGGEGKPMAGAGGQGPPVPLTGKEIAAANAAGKLAEKEVAPFFIQHKDIDGKGEKAAQNIHDLMKKAMAGAGFGAIMNPVVNQPPVDPVIRAIVEEKFRKVRIKGHKMNPMGKRMNLRVASRARFTGEMNVFRAPARKDVRNGRFVLLQDISSSMGQRVITLNGHLREKIEMAYHFGKAMEEFLTQNGAKVESYRYHDNPFYPGLSLVTEGGTRWSDENAAMLKMWVQEGRQVIILTDGDINFDNEDEVRELFSRADKRPIGMQLGASGGSPLERVCPDWAKFRVTNDPEAALEAIVTELSRRYAW